MTEKKEEAVEQKSEQLESHYAVQNALTLDWVFGFNKDMISSVHNLSDEIRKEIFYVTGHIGVIHNYDKGEQILLQGHTNQITCCCVSRDKRWIVTACAGKENMVVVWDSIKGIPVKIIFNPHPNGTEAIDISSDNMYLATLSRVQDGEQQVLSLWEWTSENQKPIYSSTVSTNDIQKVVRFNPEDSHYLVTNGSKRVIFWSCAESAFKFFAPPVSAKEFHTPVGDFTQSIFIPGTGLAASGTTHGDIVLWQEDASDKTAKPTDKRALKVVNVHKSAINFLTTIGPFIVTGGEDGYVRFFDHKLRIDAWFEEFDAGPIHSISFEREPIFQRPGTGETDNLDTPSSKPASRGKSTARSKQGVNEETVKPPDFIVATGSALILNVKSDAFHDYNVNKLKGDLIVQGQEGAIQCLAAHPTKPYLAISGLSGHLHLWDYTRHKVVSLTLFKNLEVISITFDPKGEYMAVGFSNGMVKVLKVQEKLVECQSFKISKAIITDIVFSHDSMFFAFADSDNCVGLFRWGHRDDDERKEIEWVYIGRHRAHKHPITGLQFGVSQFGGAPRLMSVGEDRRLVEYDLASSCIVEGLKIKAVYKIGQSSIPTAFLWPRDVNVTVRCKCEPEEMDSLLFANNEYKFQSFYTPDTVREPICRKTLLSPTYGGPVNRLMIVNDKDPSQAGKLMAYSTQEKVIGLIKLPMDGRPDKSMGVIAHSGEITSCVVSADGDFLFTAGGSDFTVNKWKINKQYMENLGNDDAGLQPYIDLIEGGEKGEFFQEIKQYFYYAQIRSQGEDTTSAKKITGRVVLSQIPFLIRAIDFYASNYEIENLVREIKMQLGGDEAEKKKKASGKELDIDFESFIKVYVNHRSVFGIKKKDIENAFKRLGADPLHSIIVKDHLLKMLTNMGEKMSQEELNSCLKTLLGSEPLSEQFTANEFAQNVLGFEDYDENEEYNETEELEDDQLSVQ